jgi:hypothetical protein
MGILCNAGDVQAVFKKRARKKVMKLRGFMSTLVSLAKRSLLNRKVTR